MTRLRASELVELSFRLVNPLRAQRQADVDILSSGIITAPRTLQNDPVPLTSCNTLNPLSNTLNKSSDPLSNTINQKLKTP